MSKITLDRETFKALASDTRLDILRALDGKKMSLKDLSKATKLNKATLHEHLTKLTEVGLVKKKEREGHKWVYYKLSWKGESLLHPENTKIVVLFSTTFFVLFLGIIQLITFAKGKIIGLAQYTSDKAEIYAFGSGSAEFTSMAKTAGAYSHNIKVIPDYGTFYKLSEIPYHNNTTVPLDVIGEYLSKNVTLKGLVGNPINYRDIDWSSLPTYDSSYNSTASLGVNEGYTDSMPTIIASVHDPALLYIAIFCIVIFSILLSVAIWRLWKNRVPQI